MNKDILKEDNRDFYFDNIKGLLIFLVVLGHFFEIMNNQSIIIESLYSFIYIFHMPLFIFISGYFSKNFKLKKVLNLVAVYLLWQGIIYPLAISIFTNSNYLKEFSGFLIPKFSYWYLLALILWKLVSAILPRNIIMLIIITIISFIPGTLSEFDFNILSLGRFISLYPFFYLGYLINKDTINTLISKLPKKVCILNLLIVLFITYHLFVTLDYSKKILFFRDSYTSFIDTIPLGLLTRGIVIILALICIISICTLIPRNKNIFTIFGMNTLTIYLYHAPLLSAMKNFIDINKSNQFEFCFILVGCIFSYSFCKLMSSPKISKYASKATNINLFN